MSRVETDVLIIGAGLGATATAQGLARSGYRVTLVPGVGCTRSSHIDGGLVDPSVVASVFGDGAPLGDPVDRKVTFRAISPGRIAGGPGVSMQPRLRYRRQEFERWAMQGAIDHGAVFLEDFVEGHVVPMAGQSAVLTSGQDDREIVARVIVLCEGADPRIAMRVNLRPDYSPNDLLHFARTLFRGRPSHEVRQGSWRTSWGMPVDVYLIPQTDGKLISVSTRIENVMRVSRSSKDALEDILASAAFDFLDVRGERGQTGMELVALGPRHRGLTFVHDRLVMGIDFSGVIDPRQLDRADLTIRAGQHLAAYLVDRELSLDGWQGDASRFVRETIASPPPYHDDKETGYLEEGPPHAAGKIAARLAGFIRRGPRASTVIR